LYITLYILFSSLIIYKILRLYLNLLFLMFFKT
jgi:hypothetical protein